MAKRAVGLEIDRFHSRIGFISAELAVAFLTETYVYKTDHPFVGSFFQRNLFMTVMTRKLDQMCR
jgi:hypothetical protein